MKKTYSKIIFSVVMLSLAIFSATFGIYAIMTAEMNMNLNIGYVAYNCSANVSGVITGASLEAEELPEDIQLSSVEVNGKNKQTQSMDLGTFYFTTEGVKNALGKPYPIKVWFTIENTSEFPICVEVSLPTITDVEVVADKTSHVIQAGETDKIMVTFTLTNISTTSLERGFSSSGLNFTFRKFLKTKQDIVVYKDATVTHFENHPYYIKFGTNLDNSDILWLVGGTMDADGQAVALTDADKTQLDTGKFAEDVDYYIISSGTLYSSDMGGAVPYQNNFYFGTEWNSEGYLYEYPNGPTTRDYSVSAVRQYLLGFAGKTGWVRDSSAGTITPNFDGHDTINLVELYDLDKFIYTLIKKRPLSAIYKTLGYGNTEEAVPTDKVDNLSVDESDAFWLSTAADLAVLGDDWIANRNGKRYTFVCPTHSNKYAIQNVFYYKDDGVITTSGVGTSGADTYAVRPAFII